MDIIDEHGNLFGIVNVIDALVVLLLAAVVVAGVALVVGQGPSETASSTEDVPITVQVEDTKPYVAAAIPEGAIETKESIISVDDKSVEPSRVVVRADNGTLHERAHPLNRTVTMDVTLSVSEALSDGQAEYRFNGQPLEVGRTLTLDLGRVSISGIVTDFEFDAE
ncbi:Uncharacterized protein SVXHr_0623 [Halorhabdus sp. SVX81]|uniref:DUF4330 domain-containing protein n=1 Tax=Halorhabdus sp. SVX81 TaxID=2978283 RepID=UPI0023DC5583|nr:DUF4330 domain-containing protein [Halorhabdus sp. SVX81]WEL16802.1 Uncharacterized protein SVXHr_0623 [Halorhabdus sp. SVX81]